MSTGSVFVQLIASTDHPAQGTAGTDENFPVGEAQQDFTLTEVSIIPNAALVADATNNRTFTLQNRGQDGTGTTVLATLVTNLAGGSWAAFDEKLMTLSGTAANLLIAQGDVLAMIETHAGTGVAHPAIEVYARGTRR